MHPFLVSGTLDRFSRPLVLESHSSGCANEAWLQHAFRFLSKLASARCPIIQAPCLRDFSMLSQAVARQEEMPGGYLLATGTCEGSILIFDLRSSALDWSAAACV